MMENLCPKYKYIYEEMIELKRNGDILNVWTLNGHVHYKVRDSDQEKWFIVTIIDNL